MNRSTINESVMNRSVDTFSQQQRVTHRSTVAEPHYPARSTWRLSAFALSTASKLPEIALCVGMTPGAVRLRLHRLKAIHPHPELFVIFRAIPMESVRVRPRNYAMDL